jgi:hypothetical protein
MRRFPGLATDGLNPSLPSLPPVGVLLHRYEIKGANPQQPWKVNSRASHCWLLLQSIHMRGAWDRLTGPLFDFGRREESQSPWP